MLENLNQLQKDIYSFSLAYDGEFTVNYSPKILFSQIGDLYDISFFGEGWDDSPHIKLSEVNYDENFAFCSLIELLCNQKNADKVLSLNFSGPDEGANGTKSWNFNRLLNSNVVFPNLRNFGVQLTDLGDHNQSIIDNGHLEEGGTIAKLLARMPVLEHLVVPSAPGKSFFDIGRHPLQYLTVQAGYDHQNFIENLANSENLRNLIELDYTDIIDFHEVEKEDFTSFNSFFNLLKSEAFSSIKHFTLRHSNLTEEQLFELQRLRNVQFMYIKAHGGRYVSNLMKRRN